MKSITTSIEPLESRIAPAGLATLHLSADGHTATYTDVDGDHVTIKITGYPVGGGVLTADLFTGVAGAHGDQLQALDLGHGAFNKAAVTFSVTKVAGGDGLVNVGYILSIGYDLGAVVIPGDLGQIDAGSNDQVVPAIKSLTVRSMGRLGIDTQPPSSNLGSDINGALGSLKVSGDVKDAEVHVFGGATATIGSITIGGSLIGGTGGNNGAIFSSGDMGVVTIRHDVQGGSGPNSGLISSGGKLKGVTIGGSVIGGAMTGGANSFSGEIYSGGDMGPVKIGHDLQGGSGANSGVVSSSGNMAAFFIGGSLIGGAGMNSGLINVIGNLSSVSVHGSIIGGPSSFSGNINSTGNMGAVTIGHDVQGGAGGNSGVVASSGKLTSITIGGSLLGGTANSSGEVISTLDMGAVKIAHNLVGGSINDSAATLVSSGLIGSVQGRIASVTIGGSIIAGIDNSSVGILRNDAAIRAGDDIGSVTVTGGIVGNATANGLSIVLITARGQHTPGATTDVAIGRITVGGRVEYAEILAGYDTNLNPVNGDAQIGAVSVGGDWIASNLLAGVENLGTDDTPGGTGTAADNGNFGDTHDVSIGAGSLNIVSRIASVTIAGQVFGTPLSLNPNDHFGFVAQQIGLVKIGGTVIGAPAGNTPLDIGETTDFSIHLVA